MHLDRPEWLQKVEKITEEAAISQGCYLYDLEFSGMGRGRTLRIFIDKEEGGSGIEDCSNVSKALNEKLDADENLIPGGEYNLEVSTPGLDRVLKKDWHYTKAKGKKIWVKLAGGTLSDFGVTEKGMINAKQIEEVLQDFKDNKVVFNIKGQEVQIPFEKVEKANLVFKMETGKKK